MAKKNGEGRKPRKVKDPNARKCPTCPAGSKSAGGLRLTLLLMYSRSRWAAKRAKSAYLFYFSKRRPEVISENEGTKISVPDMARQVGAEWSKSFSRTFADCNER